MWEDAVVKMNNKNKDLPFVTESPKLGHIYLLP